MREVEASSDRGLQISIGRGILRFPVIVLNDEVLAVESISEEALRAAIEGSQSRS